MMPTRKPGALQGTADHRHAEAGVIYVGIPRHQDDVAGIPPESIHLLPGHGQERRRAEARGPVLAAG
jgi:hypothetical protein